MGVRVEECACCVNKLWKNVHAVSTNFAKTLVWEYEYDVKL